MNMKMHTEAPEIADPLPDDFTSAWVSVLLDLWERQPKTEMGSSNQDGLVSAMSIDTEDQSHVA